MLLTAGEFFDGASPTSSGLNNEEKTLSHPPNSEIVNNWDGRGNNAAVAAATDG